MSSFTFGLKTARTMDEDVHSIIPTTFDSELIAQLGATEFEVQHPAPYFSFIEQHLPIVGSMASGGELLCAKESASAPGEWWETIQLAIVRQVGEASPQHMAVVVGDNMMHYAYALRYSQFIQHMEDFFSIPQDTYVLLQSSKVCFQYSYEDQLFLYRLD
ncbi:hypothetical protein LGH70_04495 [Hymenobacter sp. BT635]|uniref:Uncharacterized protein n=1 Tax=Hymenobacter nitidus TaxID=2880929 RepID=A0ABS8A8V1_9BACT|nr:hypothetical protein [Hymenobacter nitidus]MCB2376826.1 hypothetical protein [Hymenobacter nitidus]